MKTILVGLLWSVNIYGQWMSGVYAAQNGVLPISSIPWNKYTHITHFAAAPDASGNGTVSLHYLTQAEINELIASRPAGKKVLLCIKDNDANYNAFAQSTSAANISQFVTNIVNFVNANGYDGVDIDWERNINMTQFSDLLSRLRTSMPDKTIAMDALDTNGPVAAVSQVDLDQINVMCYDMDNGQNCHHQNCIWHNNALLQNGEGDKRTCDWRVRALTRKGVQNSKIGIGLPFFGRRRTGATQPEIPGTFPAYSLPYRALVADSTRWQTAYMQYDALHKADYLSIPSLNEFISYLGAQSIKDTVAWHKAQAFGGFMTYSLDYEYVSTQAGDALYPLSTALYNEVFGTVALPTGIPEARSRSSGALPMVGGQLRSNRP